MSKDKNAIKSQLVRLMMHVLKFLIQPLKRTASWIASINNARDEIEKYTRKKPSLKNYILSIWDGVFRKAKLDAEDETGENCDIEELDWETVFNKKFGLDDDEKNTPK